MLFQIISGDYGFSPFLSIQNLAQYYIKTPNFTDEFFSQPAGISLRLGNSLWDKGHAFTSFRLFMGDRSQTLCPSKSRQYTPCSPGVLGKPSLLGLRGEEALPAPAPQVGAEHTDQSLQENPHHNCLQVSATPASHREARGR